MAPPAEEINPEYPGTLDLRYRTNVTDSQVSNTPQRSPVCPAYRQPPTGYDEMCTGQGKVRKHWRYLIDSLDAMGPEVLQQRQRDTVRMLRSDGATYNVYGAPDGLNRTWQLDPVPLLISSSEWAGIEAGLTQRAELLNLILRDLYGPRSLIRKGLIPPNWSMPTPASCAPAWSPRPPVHRG